MSAHKVKIVSYYEVKIFAKVCYTIFSMFCAGKTHSLESDHESIGMQKGEIQKL